MNEIIVSINRNGLLSKKITFTKYLIMDTIDFNKHVHDIDTGGDITRRFELRF